MQSVFSTANVFSTGPGLLLDSKPNLPSTGRKKQLSFSDLNSQNQKVGSETSGGRVFLFDRSISSTGRKTDSYQAFQAAMSY